MARYLILKLEGVLQSWGGHTFEDVRPSELFPTRSGLLGLLAACCGIPRTQRDKLQVLAESVQFSVRIDKTPFRLLKMIDYHTVKDARDSYIGLKSHETIQSWREYLQDAKYTVAIANTAEASPEFSLDNLKQAIQKPHYTPYLGRRSCPITRPLYFTEIDAEHGQAALNLCEPKTGIIYTEETHDAFKNKPSHLIRDVPIAARKRQFATRSVTILAGG